MSDRPIQQIIGWEWRETSWPVENRSSPGYDADPTVPYRRESHGYWAPPGQHVDDNGCEPTVDELLAWLLSLPGFAFENKFYGPMTMWGSKLGFVVTMTDADGDEVSSDCKPTLLESLEQLVRLLDNYERENADA